MGFVLLLVFLLVWLAVLGLGFLTGKTFGDLLLRPPTRAEQDAYRNSP